jgi:flagellar basal-body rod protein FlgB
VSLETEMIKVSDTQAQFQAAANIYAKTMSMMRTAIGH